MRTTQGKGLLPDGTTRFKCKGKDILSFVSRSALAQQPCSLSSPPRAPPTTGSSTYLSALIRSDGMLHLFAIHRRLQVLRRGRHAQSPTAKGLSARMRNHYRIRSLDQDSRSRRACSSCTASRADAARQREAPSLYSVSVVSVFPSSKALEPRTAPKSLRSIPTRRKRNGPRSLERVSRDLAIASNRSSPHGLQ